LILLGDGMEFSGNQKGGSPSRIRQEFYLRNRMWFSYLYPLLGLGPERDNSFLGGVYNTTYRPSELIQNLVHVEKEADNYWHLQMKNYDGSYNKLTYVTPYYNLGSAMGTNIPPKWVLNIKTFGASFKLWINTTDSINNYCDADYINNGNVQGICDKSKLSESWTDWLPKLGGINMVQYKNSFLAPGTFKSLHVYMEGDKFDEGMENLVDNGNGYAGDYNLDGSGWKFFKKDKVALALKNGGSSWAGEVAIIGSDYPNFDAFKAAMESAQLTDKAFKNSKGIIICRNFSLSDNMNCTGTLANSIFLPQAGTNLPFDRMETVYGDNTGQKGKLIDWNNNIMKLNKNSQTCIYNFNDWTYSGTGCEGGGDIGSSGENTNYNGCGYRTVAPGEGNQNTETEEETLDSSFNYKSDLNNDNEINIKDFGILLSFWGRKADFILQSGRTVDLDDSKEVDIGDVAVLLSCWNSESFQCPSECCSQK
jgi:hypothetical protein